MKRKFALLLSLMLLLCSCSEKTGSDATSSTMTTTASTDTSATTTTVTEEEPLKVEKKLEIVANVHTPLDETFIDYFEEKYGIAEKGDTSYGEEFKDSAIVTIYTSYLSRYDEVAKLTASGQSPDILVDYKGNVTGAIRGGFIQPIDDIIDTYSEEWSDTREYMNMLMFGGKNYFAVTGVKAENLLLYRKDIFESYGLKDPYELYKNGEWTYDEVLEIAEKFCNKEEEKYLSSGLRPTTPFLSSSESPFAELSDGKVKHNLSDPSVEAALDFVETLAVKDYITYHPNEANYWREGNTLFFCGTESTIASEAVKHAERYNIDVKSLGIVPVPSLSESVRYSLDVTTEPLYLYLKGSDNPEGVAAWLECVNEVTHTDEYKKAEIEYLKQVYGYTDELAALVDEIENECIKRIDISDSIGIMSVYEKGIVDVSYIHVMFDYEKFKEGNSYSELRNDYLNNLEEVISDINSCIK